MNPEEYHRQYQDRYYRDAAASRNYPGYKLVFLNNSYKFLLNTGFFVPL